MTRGKERRSEGTDWLSIVSFGFFFVLLGVIWMINPGLWSNFVEFLRPSAWHLEKMTEHIFLPAPRWHHPAVYTAAMQFCLAFGVFQIVVLALRFILGESLDRKTGTVSGIVFWLGAGFFLNMLAIGDIGWFGFLAGLIIVIGLLIIVSSLLKLLFKRV